MNLSISFVVTAYLLNDGEHHVIKKIVCIVCCMVLLFVLCPGMDTETINQPTHPPTYQGIFMTISAKVHMPCKHGWLQRQPRKRQKNPEFLQRRRLCQSLAAKKRVARLTNNMATS